MFSLGEKNWTSAKVLSTSISSFLIFPEVEICQLFTQEQEVETYKVLPQESWISFMFSHLKTLSIYQLSYFS